MATQKQGTAFPWSFSSLQMFEQCPRKFHYIRITKEVKDEMNEVGLWGNRGHQAIAASLKNKVPLRGEWAKYQPIVDRVAASPGRKNVEVKFGITEDLRPTTFFAKDVWYRGIIDLQVVGTKAACAFDWKFGKVRENSDQLKLFAAATFAQYPFVQSAHTMYVWLPHGKTTPQVYYKEEADSLWAEFLPRLARMKKAEETQRWLPNPTGLCHFCPVGPTRCEFWLGYAGENR